MDFNLCFFGLLFFLLFDLVSCKNEAYRGSKVYKLNFKSENQFNELNKLKNDNIDYWRKPSLKHNVDALLMVPETDDKWAKIIFDDLDIDASVHINDVFEYLNEKENSPMKSKRIERNDAFGFDAYYHYDQILEHLQDLEAANLEYLKITEYKATEENRPLVYLQIPAEPNPENPTVLVEAGAIPRDWITIPAAVYIVTQLLEVDNRNFVNQVNWIVVPVLNPDGYEYTHSDLRLWTKNLSTKSQFGFICPGANVDRNFDIDWLSSDSSSSPCSHLYAGVEAFSETESQLIRDLLTNFNIRTYISLQSSTGFVSYPWSFERAASGMYIQHHLLGLRMIEALNTSGYFIDSGSNAQGDRTSGTSSDFAQENGVLYSFNLDIMPSEGGVDVNEELIIATVESVWRAMKAVAEYS